VPSAVIVLTSFPGPKSPKNKAVIVSSCA